jgi:L-iditol 2-dehydrogenase
MRVKALVMEKYGEFSFREVPTPSPGPDEALIRVRACAVCGSDVHGMDGSTGRRRPPVIMGTRPPAKSKPWAARCGL